MAALVTNALRTQMHLSALSPCRRQKARRQAGLRLAVHRFEKLFVKRERLLEAREVCRNNVALGKRAIALLKNHQARDCEDDRAIQKFPFDIVSDDSDEGSVIKATIGHGFGLCEFPEDRPSSISNTVSGKGSSCTEREMVRGHVRSLAWARLFLWVSTCNLRRTEASLAKVEACIQGKERRNDTELDSERSEKRQGSLVRRACREQLLSFRSAVMTLEASKTSDLRKL